MVSAPELEFHPILAAETGKAMARRSQGTMALATQIADEPAADLGAVVVDSAPVAVKELAAVLDDQFVGAVQREMQSGGAKLSQPPVLLKRKVHVWKRATTKGSAITAADRIVKRLVQQQAVSFLYLAPS